MNVGNRARACFVRITDIGFESARHSIESWLLSSYPPLHRDWGSGMEIYDQLRANCDKLLEAYHSNLEDVQKLQDTLIRDILPSVTDELNLTPDATEWAEEWLSDTGTCLNAI